MDNAEQYSIARAQNGTLGIAYISNEFVIANGMDVKYMTSTDEGLTWSTPTVVYDATPSAQLLDRAEVLTLFIPEIHQK